MKKIAVCLSGQPRFFREGHKYLTEAFKGYDVDYFCHFWHDREQAGQKHEIHSKTNKIYSSTIEENDDKEILDLFSPAESIIEKQIQFEDTVQLSLNNGKRKKTTQPPDVFISMLYSRYQAGDLLRQHIKKNGNNYDLAVWTRTDFAPLGLLINEVSSSEVYHTGYAPGSHWNKSVTTTSFHASSVENILYYLNLFKFI